MPTWGVSTRGRGDLDKLDWAGPYSSAHSSDFDLCLRLPRIGPNSPAGGRERGFQFDLISPDTSEAFWIRRTVKAASARQREAISSGSDRRRQGARLMGSTSPRAGDGSMVPRHAAAAALYGDICDQVPAQ